MVLLYTEGCPHAADYLPQLSRLLAAEGIDEPVRSRLVISDDQAQREHFLGSPTIRVNGRDVDPTAEHRNDYSLSCRLYRGPDGVHGTPPDVWVQTHLRANRAEQVDP